MIWKVGTPIRAGEVTCVPIAHTLVSASGRGRRLAGHCEKRPVLFLLFRNERVTGLDLNGRVFDRDDIERRFPDAIAEASEKLKQS